MVIVCVYLRGDGSSHVCSLPGKVEGLDAGGPVPFESQEVDDVQQLGWEEGHSQVEDAVTEANGAHQPFHSRRREQAKKREKTIDISKCRHKWKFSLAHCAG